MIVKYIYRICWCIGLILLQVLVLNNIHILGLLTPFFYVYFILKFDSGCSRNELMLWGFFIGLMIDIFSDSPGLHASAAVLLAFIRPVLLRLFTPRDAFDSIVPSIRTMGLAFYYKYLFSAVFLHHSVLLFLGYLSWGSISYLLLKIVGCTLFTVLCITAVEWIKKEHA